MKRLLTFGSDPVRAARRYDLLHQAMHLALVDAIDGPVPQRMTGLRSIDVMRREAALLDKLDAISEPDLSRENPPQVPKRRLVTDPGQYLELTQPEHELLRERLDPSRMPWLPGLASEIVRLIDWVDAADKIDDRSPSEIMPTQGADPVPARG